MGLVPLWIVYSLIDFGRYNLTYIDVRFKKDILCVDIYIYHRSGKSQSNECTRQPESKRTSYVSKYIYHRSGKSQLNTCTRQPVAHNILAHLEAHGLPDHYHIPQYSVCWARWVETVGPALNLWKNDKLEPLSILLCNRCLASIPALTE